MRVVIQGGRTRLGGALLALPELKAQTVELVSRNEADSEWIAEHHPQAQVLACDRESPIDDSEKDGTILICCAIGPIHPVALAWDRDRKNVDRDLQTVRRVLTPQASARRHVVFVSSAVALAPRRDRSIYAGWKNLVEGELRGIAASVPNTQFSVVFPGRLVERRGESLPFSMLYAPYRRLATWIWKTAQLPAGRLRLLGVDTRLWLMVQGLRAGVAAMRGSP